jgi:hypothetical protein
VTIRSRKTVAELSAFIQKQNPGMRRFSPQDAKVSPVVRQIHSNALSTIKDSWRNDGRLQNLLGGRKSVSTADAIGMLEFCTTRQAAELVVT